MPCAGAVSRLTRALRSRRGGGRLAALVLLSAGALGLLALAPPRHARHHASALFPGSAPHKLAHSLADFSIQPDVGSWSVLEDTSSAGRWRYAVAFSCGARCSGRALVAALERHAGPPAHGPAAPLAHEVRLRVARCTRAPLLPWPTFCDEMTINSLVKRSGGGAEVLVEATAECGTLSVLAGAGGGCDSRLRHYVDTLMQIAHAQPT